MAAQFTCYNCGVQLGEAVDVVLSEESHSDVDKEVSLPCVEGAQELCESPPLSDEEDHATSEGERVRLLMWLAQDNAEPQSPSIVRPPDSPSYFRPQAGLLWNARFVRTPPRSRWESCSDEEGPMPYVFPFGVYPRIDPEDVRRSPSPIESEYWDRDKSDVYSDYSANPHFVFPSPPPLRWRPSRRIMRALGVDSDEH